MTFTPSLSRRLATLRDTDSAKVGRTRLPASSRMMLAFARIDAAEVTPQCNPHHVRQRRREFHAGGTRADQHERHLSRAFVLVLSRCGQFERAQDFGSDRLGIDEALEPRRISRELVVPEVARPHAGRDHQIIERDLADADARGGRLNRAGSNVDARDLRQELR